MTAFIAIFGPSVNFTSVLRAAFTQVDPESVKKHSSHQYLFTLLGSATVKAVSGTLMKLGPTHVKAAHKILRNPIYSYSRRTASAIIDIAELDPVQELPAENLEEES